MEQLKYYYEFIGQKYHLPLSLCINGFSNTLFHQGDCLEIVYVLKGQFIVNIGTNEYILKSRSFAVIAPNEIHCIRKSNASDDSEMLIVHIAQNDIMDKCISKTEMSLFSFVIDDTSDLVYNSLKSSLKSIFKIIIDGNVKKYSLLNIISYQMLVAVYSHPKEEKINRKIEYMDKDNYFRIVDYLNKNYRNNIKLDDVANYLHFSSSYTSKFIKKYTGESFVKYLSRIRIRASLEDLINSNMTVLDIALKYGFSSVKAYTMFFKEFYKVTPIVYRKRFISNEKIGEYDKSGRLLEITEEKYKLISHLFDDDRVYSISIDSKPLRDLDKIMKSIIIRDIGFCIEPSNLIVIEDITDIFNLDNIYVDCRMLTSEQYLQFGYGIMGMLDFFAKNHIAVNIVTTDKQIQQMFSKMIDMISTRYENSHFNFVDSVGNFDKITCHTISDFMDAFIKGTVLPIYFNKVDNNDIYLIDKYNFKSNHLFILAMINRMYGQLLYSDDGICISRSGSKIKIMLYYDTNIDDADKRIFDISINKMYGQFLRTSYYVTEVINEEGEMTKNDSREIYNSKNRQYIKNKGKFGHSTEVLRCNGICNIKEELLQNQIKVIILNNL